MQTVPSLVGSGAALAAAALGLAFAEPEPQPSPPPTSTLNRKRAYTNYDGPSYNPRLSSAPASSRPGTSSASLNPPAEVFHPSSLPDASFSPTTANTPRPHRPTSSTQLTPPKVSSRRQSFVRQADGIVAPTAEDSRDSVSSNGSWMRRLSLRPLSQHGSLRSSAGPETHSIAFSHGSSAPILSPSGTYQTPLPPNKLVKRAPSAHQNGAGDAAPRQVAPPLDYDSTEGLEAQQYSLDRYMPAQDVLSLSPVEPYPPPRAAEPSRWTSLFHSRTINVPVSRTPDRLLEPGAAPLSKRLRVFVEDKNNIYLVRASVQQRTNSEQSTSALHMARQRNSSSPLPPLSRLSSFNVDLTRLGSSATVPQPRSNQPSGSSQSSAAMASYKNARHERSSTLNSSDYEVRGFGSGDDEDTDFRSDTMFDSIRTLASVRNRAVESPLESMFDESPPSTAGNGKTKRLSIQEILGRGWDADEMIMEEDENMSTPVRASHDRKNLAGIAPAPTGYSYERPSNDYSLSNKDLSRLSLEDDFEDDWARDDDEMGFGNQLSPPSSMNSRGVSPNLRLALASISGKDVADVAQDLRGERPRSNLFDWTETNPGEHSAEGQLRPKTVHGRQEMDMRGGRPSNRKGPVVAHVRSQSVPVVYDPTDNAKAATQKFGTWGLGTKGASEDWDDDFEFGGSDEGGGVHSGGDLSMMVPASIQASQPSLKQHSGQIRELSLLVNDLKRLCRHGRDLDLLDGTHAALWHEAGGIISLASPDEDELEGMDVDSSDLDFEPYSVNERLADNNNMDTEPAKKPDDPFEAHDLRLAKTTVIRERPAGRRRSVFSPDDDIFGGNGSITDASAASSRPKTPENNINMGGHDVTDIVKSVLDAMQQRSASDSSHNSARASEDKVHFGTNNLKALVKRAGDLRDLLSEAVRRVDQITSSPMRTPRRHERESPAFTRVFTPEPPSSSPPKRLPHSQSTNSVLSRGSHEASPSTGLNQRMQMMTVS
ncbi:conserved hypothetical protein [Verticillium alfalfae VaMs.102]|uniref:Uncharacterized protein n=1 Tax=Verticillium alfalfae (strain VaMs.102 / ATCC MYA-4576 / FGSC 10136) TaxID=526221 RepID=C9STF9_VERA1|nr:conserved hypothetical protein [Verticillium alfalfae VaMs.102]EEY22074.1 conserved hypothetical protein [Verticillium alfalfae VaMs.102]